MKGKIVKISEYVYMHTYIKSLDIIHFKKSEKKVIFNGQMLLCDEKGMKKNCNIRISTLAESF